jgi:adenine deaminase
MKPTADLLLTGGNLVNVFSGEIYPEQVAVRDGRIIGFGAYTARRRVDISGHYLCPGFIDGHIHLESSMLAVPAFARAVSPHGTTSVIADPHEIANVLGLDGIKWMLTAAKYQPLNLFLTLPSCVPATELETSGARLSSFDLYPFISQQWVVGLGEMMNFPAVLASNPDIINKIAMSREKFIDGHAPGLTGTALDAYIACGIRSEHESTTVAEAREKLRKGMYVLMREGSATKNLDDLLPVLQPANSRRILFVSDDRHPQDLLQGHLDLLVRRAVRAGVPAVDAIRAVTLNPAECYGLKNLGAIAPGYEADLVVLNNLNECRVMQVYHRGNLVAREGAYVGPSSNQQVPLRSSVNVRWLAPEDLRLPARPGKARVIGLVPGQIITRQRLLKPAVAQGQVVSDTVRDILKIVVVERHQASGNIGKGLVQGFGLQRGAIASSVAHDSHNIVAVGCDDESLFTAILAVIKMGGGLAVAEKHALRGKLPLPIAGLMSPQPLGVVAAAMESLLAETARLGSPLKDPFMALSFLALPVIPALKLTDRGLVDVAAFELVGLWKPAAPRKRR